MTTLILHGYDTITFGVDSIQAATTGYYVPADTINIHETERENIVYSNTRFGGSAVSTTLSLAPFSFTCFVWGSSRSEMLDRAKTLARIVNNEGMVEYKPTDASISTYYDYVKSARPTKANINKNQWDDINKDSNRYVMAFEVNLQTKPIGHSNVYTDLGQELISNSGEVTLTNIVGDYPAIVRSIISTGNSETLNRFYICTRSSVLSTLSNIELQYEAEDAVSSTGIWTNQVDASRSGGEYERITGDDTWRELRFTINNEPDHRGLITFLPVVRTANTDVEFRIVLYNFATPIYTSPDTYKPVAANKWQALYCGEFTLPAIGLSDLPDYQYLRFAVQAKGTGNIDVDFVQIMFSDESIMDIQITSALDGGLPPTTGFLIVDADTDYKRTTTAATYVISSYRSSGVIYRIYGSLALQAQEDTKLFYLFHNASDYHDPNDTVYVTHQVLYRTIYPFS